MKKPRRFTMFVNGNYITFDYTEKVEANLIAWVETMMANPEKQMAWLSDGTDGTQFIKIVLKGSMVDGYYFRDQIPTPPDNQSKVMKMLERLMGQDGEDWKKE